MNIYSWNIFYENKKLDEVLLFITESDFDIFCLQEVPYYFLLRLQTLPYSIAYVEESMVVSKFRKFPIYSVTLSKHSISSEGSICLNTMERTFKVRFTRFFINLFNKEKVIAIQDHKILFTDIFIEGKEYRVFNLHLSLTYPKRRMEELVQVMENYMKDASILCGDFNILESFHVSVLNWLLGGTLSEWFFYKIERIKMEAFFKHYNLYNPLRNHSTHPISHSQLDHILVPQAMITKRSRVIHKRYGSDHCPIQVEVK